MIYKRKCKLCGKEFETKYSKQVFCCGKCRKQNGLNKLNNDRVKVEKHTQICLYCGKEYKTFKNRQKYCCIECKKAHYSEIHKVKEKKVKYDYGEKICKKCGITFKPNSGRQEYCEECIILRRHEHNVIYGKKRYQENREELKARAKARRDARTVEEKQKAREYNKQYVINNREKLKEQNRKYVEEHKEELRIKQQIYRKEHREEINARERERYKANPEKAIAYQKQYRSNPENKEKINSARRKAERKRRANDPAFKMRRTCREMIRRCIKAEKNGKSSKTILGYTSQQLKEHIESQLLPDMTWENYGILWHIDHIKPLKAFNFFNEDGTVNWDVVREANGLKNLRPLYADENIAKSNTWTSEDEEEYQKLIKH